MHEWLDPREEGSEQERRCESACTCVQSEIACVEVFFLQRGLALQRRSMFAHAAQPTPTWSTATRRKHSPSLVGSDAPRPAVGAWGAACPCSRVTPVRPQIEGVFLEVLKHVCFQRRAGIGHITLPAPGGVCTGTTNAGRDSQGRQGSPVNTNTHQPWGRRRLCRTLHGYFAHTELHPSQDNRRVLGIGLQGHPARQVPVSVCGGSLINLQDVTKRRPARNLLYSLSFSRQVQGQATCVAVVLCSLKLQ